MIAVERRLYIARFLYCDEQVANDDQDGAQCHELTELDAEGEKIGHEPVGRDVVFNDLRRQAEAMHDAEDEGCDLGVRPKAKPPLEVPILSSAL